MDIVKLILPNVDLEHFLSATVQISPYSECWFSISKDNVEEADNSVRFSFLLPFLFHVILNNFLGEVLKIKPKVILQSPGNYVSFDDVFQPILFYLLVNEANMPHVQSTNMDEFS